MQINFSTKKSQQIEVRIYILSVLNFEGWFHQSLLTCRCYCKNSNILHLSCHVSYNFINIHYFFSETGPLTRSTARKRQSRELVMMCIQTARLQHLPSSTNWCLVIYTVGQFTRLILLLSHFCLSSIFCDLLEVISLIHKVFIYIWSVYLGDWSSPLYTKCKLV